MNPSHRNPDFQSRDDREKKHDRMAIVWAGLLIATGLVSIGGLDYSHTDAVFTRPLVIEPAHNVYHFAKEELHDLALRVANATD